MRDIQIRIVEIDHPEIHTVEIKERPDGSRYAVPYEHRDTFEDGTKWLHEPDGFEPGADYRDALADVGVSLDGLEIDREIPTYSFEEVDPV